MAHLVHIDAIPVADKTVEPLALPLADPLGATIETKTYNLYSTDDDSLHAGTWETGTGESRWEFTDEGEVIYVLEGRMTVQEDGGSSQEVGPGDLVVFPKGWKGTWNVTAPLRKVYVIYS